MKKLRIRIIPKKDAVEGETYFVLGRHYGDRMFYSLPGVLEFYDDETGAIFPVEVVVDEQA